MIGIVIALIVVGAALYLINLIPMDATIKRVISVLIIVVVIIWVLLALVPMIPHSAHLPR